MNKEEKLKCKQCEWYRTGVGSSRDYHTCRDACKVLLFVEGAGEFHCNNFLPCKSHE